MLTDHLFIVLGVEHYNTLGLIRSLGEAGINPIYIAIKGKAKLASTSKYVSDCYFVDNSDEGYELLMDKFGNESDPSKLPFLFTIDDKTQELLDRKYDELEGKFIFFNAGKQYGISEYMDKYNILKLAEECGFPILKSCVVDRGSIPSDIEYPVITKGLTPAKGGWKSDVYICESEDELKSAYEKIKSDSILIQKYIDKKNEYVLEGFSINSGNEIMVSIESTYNYLIKGYYSPYSTTRSFRNDDMQSKLEAMFKKIGFEGLFEVEFLIDQDDIMYFGEINFRNSGWSYASTVAGMNLPYLWAKSMADGSVPKDAHVYGDEFTCMLEPVDYQKRVVERGMNVDDWVIQMLHCKCHYYYDPNDLEPFFEMVRNNEKLR